MTPEQLGRRIAWLALGAVLTLIGLGIVGAIGWLAGLVI